jgi:HK97 family phage major capsid protein
MGSGVSPAANGVVATMSTNSVVDTIATNAISIADVYALESDAAPRFRQQSAWLASKTTYNTVRQLFTQEASAAGDPWVRPSSGTPAEFIGYPAYEASAMQSPTTAGNQPLLFGDFSQFLIVDRIGMGIELVPHLFGSANRFPTGQRGLFALWFNNCVVLVPNAFRLLQIL